MKNAALTDTKIRAARHGGAVKQLTDGRGLYLKLMPSQVHSWRFDFKSPETGKRQTLTIGSYPDVSLEQARKRAQEARNMLAEVPPRCPASVKSGAKEARKAAQETAAKVAKGEELPGSLKAVALDCLAMKWREEQGQFVNKIQDATAEAWTQRMEAHIFPKLGARPVATIQLQELLDALQAIPSKAVAHAVKGYLKEVFNRARRMGLIPVNIALDLDEDMGKAPKSAPRPAQTTPTGFARVLRGIADYHKQDHKDALTLGALLWQRPANMAAMKWADLDLIGGQVDWFACRLDLEYSAPVWVIPAEEMKRDMDGKTNGKPHLVPLPTQAIEILKRRLAQRDPLDMFVFPSTLKAGASVSADTLTGSLREMGFEGIQSFHGFRASARTILADQLRYSKEPLEMNLAHSEGLATGVSYSRGIRLEERAEILQAWGDYLDKLTSGNVSPIKRAA